MKKMKKKPREFIPNIFTVMNMFIGFMAMGFIMRGDPIRAGWLILLACFFDVFDGKLARKYNAISKFGLVMDPLADKILVISAFIGFLHLKVLSGIVTPSMVFLILTRDILVTLLRLIMKKNGILMITSKIAKLKTATQLISVIIILICLSILEFGGISIIASHRYSFEVDIYLYIIHNTMVAVTLFTVYTGIDYYYRNIKLIIASR